MLIAGVFVSVQECSPAYRWARRRKRNRSDPDCRLRNCRNWSRHGGRWSAGWTAYTGSWHSFRYFLSTVTVKETESGRCVQETLYTEKEEQTRFRYTKAWSRETKEKWERESHSKKAFKDEVEIHEWFRWRRGRHLVAMMYYFRDLNLMSCIVYESLPDILWLVLELWRWICWCYLGDGWHLLFLNR